MGMTEKICPKVTPKCVRQQECGEDMVPVPVAKEEVGFVQSKVDECVYYKGSVMYVLYTDDSILAGPDHKDIEIVIEEIQEHHHQRRHTRLSWDKHK
jgi:hypothetical protein